MRLPVGIGCLLALALACAPSAFASSVHVERGTAFDVKSGTYSADTLVYAAAGGESNVVSIQLRGEDYEVTDSAGITAGDGCSPTTVSTTVNCHPRGTLANARYDLGDGDDRLERAAPVTYGGGTTVVGGPGDDLIDATHGGNGWLAGGPGDDDIRAGAQSSSMDGGPGADRFVGPSGFTGDLVTYRDRTAPVTVTLDGIANDGESGEGDNVGGGIDALQGGSGGDTLVAAGTVRALAGGAGDDHLVGGSGDDLLDGGAGGDTLTGGAGDDKILGYTGDYLPGVGYVYGDDPPQPPPLAGAGPDAPGTLAGDAGDDELRGGPATDAIDPGAGEDVVRGSGGGDSVSARDGALDLITCARRGSSEGSAALDERDLARRCSSVDRSGPGTPRIILLGQSDLDRDGVIRVGIGCSQDQPGGCRGTLRLARAGRVLATRRIAIPAGAAHLYKPRVRLPAVFSQRTWRKCSTRRLKVTLATRDTDGARRVVTGYVTVANTALACNSPTLLDEFSAGW